MRAYNGMYLGIVIQNNDPEKRGRVKVYVPEISGSVYKEWLKDTTTDKSFNFPDKNSDLNTILPELKNIIPWADNAMPMIGATGSGRYNAYKETGTISDSNKVDLIEPEPDRVDGIEFETSPLNTEGLGEAPGKIYEDAKYGVHDAFTNNSEDIQYPDSPTGEWSNTNRDGDEELAVGERLNGVNRPNRHAYNYKPSTYSNCAKGGFSIPNVGSHVWVFFENGKPLSPVVFAASYGENDWRGIYELHGAQDDDGEKDKGGNDYPGAYENVSKEDDPTYDNNTETYRNKYVINQKGGTLEFINTDNREGVKLSHYSGSFKEFNNHVNTELAVKNDQKLVQEDQYDTVKGFRNIYTERDLDYIVRGDYFKKVGYQNTDWHYKWREAYRPIAELKALFETQRMTGAPGNANTAQLEQKGTPLQCPVCRNKDRTGYWRVYNKYTILDTSITETSSRENGATQALLLKPGANAGKATGYFGVTNGSPYTPAGLAMPNTIFYKHSSEAINDLDSAGHKIGKPLYGDEEIHLYGTFEPGDRANDYKIFGENCPVCNGTGLSPSSMQGDWELTPELMEGGAYDTLLPEVAKALVDIERNLGLGGSEINTTAKHRVDNIGLINNDYSSIRVDPKGKMYRDKVIIHSGGVFNSETPTPLIEPVHVEDLPGGSYSINAANRWNVHVGAGGVNIKTSGRIEMSGTMFNVGADQVNIGSKNEVNIDGGKRLSIVADIISLRQRKRDQVLVDSNLGVARNVIIGGGLHVEGELSCHHITAPVEMQETELVTLFSKLLKGLQFDAVVSSDLSGPHRASGAYNVGGQCTITLTGDSNPDHVRAYDHSHLFKNVPLNLKSNNDEVRQEAQSLNKPSTDSNGNPLGPKSVRAKPVEKKTAAEKHKTLMTDIFNR